MSTALFGSTSGEHAAASAPTASASIPPVRPAAASALVEAWRQQVARTSGDLLDRQPVRDRDDAERLLAALGDALEAPILPTMGDDVAPRYDETGPPVAALTERVATLLARTADRFVPLACRSWEHMRRTAPIARTLARAFDVPPQEAFVAGLLHDVGKLVLCDAMSAPPADPRRGPAVTDAFVRDALARLHEPLGGLTLLRWGLAPCVAQAVATHHRVGRAVDRACAGGRASEVVFLAERIDLARSRGRAVTVGRWIGEGALTASPAKIAAVVDRVMSDG